ncbi:MAG: succinate dehydrogenase/fumarate reductase iron-sulfur subunit [Proteobacteria bacterium]|nr:succinate dehydrogenase/fumarate reductase iron-sulfur subunit [Pseudomonadota bacterium]
MQLTFHIWRQKHKDTSGAFNTYTVDGLSADMSFLEALDVLNEHIIATTSDESVAFDYDCREGICGTCSLVINGIPHGGGKGKSGVTSCQLHLRAFKDGDHVTVEPFRARSFPVIKDLVVDRSAFDRIIEKGGFISVNTGSAGDANATLVSQKAAEQAFDTAACIGCGACVASCKNSSAMLFVGAKVTHLASLPQGQVERSQRVKQMVEAHDKEGFGACSQTKACEAVCPKDISAHSIAQLNKEFLRATLAAK